MHACTFMVNLLCLFVEVCEVCAFVFTFNRGHTLAYFHTNGDTHETEDRSRFLDRRTTSKNTLKKNT